MQFHGAWLVECGAGLSGCAHVSCILFAALMFHAFCLLRSSAGQAWTSCCDTNEGSDERLTRGGVPTHGCGEGMDQDATRMEATVAIPFHDLLLTAC